MYITKEIFFRNQAKFLQLIKIKIKLLGTLNNELH
jgi:hypothetical protein